MSANCLKREGSKLPTGFSKVQWRRNPEWAVMAVSRRSRAVFLGQPVVWAVSHHISWAARVRLDHLIAPHGSHVAPFPVPRSPFWWHRAAFTPPPPCVPAFRYHRSQPYLINSVSSAWPHRVAFVDYCFRSWTPGSIVWILDVEPRWKREGGGEEEKEEEEELEEGEEG